MEAWFIIEFLVFLLAMGFVVVSQLVISGVQAISRQLIRWVKSRRR